MTDKQIVSFLKKYNSGKLTPQEKAILESWYLKQATGNEEIDATDLDKNLALISSNLPLRRSTMSKLNHYRIAAAASLLFFISIGTYLVLHKKKPVYTVAIAKKHDAAPGKNKATLTLSNGKKIVISDASDGQLASDAGVKIHKTKSGELVYVANNNTSSDKSSHQLVYNTMTTAKGEQYQLVLPDGTHVWLNAASSIKYPVVFDKKERVIELKGEAYFEVEHNPASPFKAKTRQQEVEVLGTHFNIYAYDDEDITRTTLVEGSVRVSSNNSHNTIIIKPGQQSIVNDYDIKVQLVDTDEALAWKNGYFEFNDESLQQIMKKICRWYNLDVEYQDGSLKGQLFSGTVSRYKNASQIIKVLELTNAAHFKIEGNKVFVTR